jgi:hypothetical protein
LDRNFAYGQLQSVESMSEHKISIGHFLGWSISAFSLIAAIVQYYEPKPKPFGALGLEGEGLHVIASTPVIDARHFATLNELDWRDSFPFQWDAMVQGKVRFVDIERYSLPARLDTLAASRDLGTEYGELDLKATYSLDPQKRMIRKFMRKEFQTETTLGELHTTSVRYESALRKGYPNIFVSTFIGKTTVHDEGEWRLKDGAYPSLLQFEHSPYQYYTQAEGITACLSHRMEWELRVHVRDVAMKPSKMSRECMKMKVELLAKANMSPETPLKVICTRGPSAQPDLGLEMDEAGAIQGAWDYAYGTQGEPISYGWAPARAKDAARKISFTYDDSGRLLRCKDSLPEQIAISEFTYLPTGWPKKLVVWVEYPDGKMRVISRSFFKFKQR